MTIRTKANTESFVMEILRPVAGISGYKSLACSSGKPVDIHIRFLLYGVILTQNYNFICCFVWMQNLVSHIKGGARIQSTRFENIAAVTTKFTVL
jgi:hypothetical protein